MLEALLPLLVLAAAAEDPGRLVPQAVEWALVAPEAGAGAEASKAFLSVAGARAPLLRPHAIGRTFERAAAVNPFDPEALATAGYDPSRPLAVMSHRSVQLLTFGVKDGEAASKKLAGWLGEIGLSRGPKTVAGGRAFVAVSGKSTVAAYAIRGDRAWACRMVENGGDAEATLRAALEAHAGKKSLAGRKDWKAVRDGPEPWRFWGTLPRTGASGALALRMAAADTLGGRGRLAAPDVAALLGAGAPAFAGADVPGALLVARARLSGKAFGPGGALRTALRWLLARGCRSCPASLADGFAEKLAPKLEGSLALVVDRLDVAAIESAGGRLDADALPHLYVLPLKDPAGVAALLAPLAEKAGLKAAPLDGGTHLAAPGLVVGVAGDVLYVGNDPGARDRALPRLRAAAAAKGGALPAEVRGEPAAISKALEPLGMGDVFGGGVLAGLFGLKVELGPLLDGSGPISGGASPQGSAVAVDLSWDLVR